MDAAAVGDLLKVSHRAAPAQSRRLPHHSRPASPTGPGQRAAAHVAAPELRAAGPAGHVGGRGLPAGRGGAAAHSHDGAPERAAEGRAAGPAARRPGGPGGLREAARLLRLRVPGPHVTHAPGRHPTRAHSVNSPPADAAQARALHRLCRITGGRSPPLAE
jgi:hypothetical protein